MHLQKKFAYLCECVPSTLLRFFFQGQFLLILNKIQSVHLSGENDNASGILWLFVRNNKIQPQKIDF